MKIASFGSIIAQRAFEPGLIVPSRPPFGLLLHPEYFDSAGECELKMKITWGTKMLTCMSILRMVSVCNITSNLKKRTPGIVICINLWLEHGSKVQLTFLIQTPTWWRIKDHKIISLYLWIITICFALNVYKLV